MSCEKCKETCCIASGRLELANGTKLFARLRFDMDFNNMDVQFGTIASGDSGDRVSESDWSDSADIKYCPFCGDELPKGYCM